MYNTVKFICRIVEIQKLIDETLDIVRSGRKDLDISRHHFTTASLGIVANYRKRTIVLEVLRSINNIKTLVSGNVCMYEAKFIEDCGADDAQNCKILFDYYFHFV